MASNLLVSGRYTETILRKLPSSHVSALMLKSLRLRQFFSTAITLNLKIDSAIPSRNKANNFTQLRLFHNKESTNRSPGSDILRKSLSKELSYLEDACGANLLFKESPTAVAEVDMQYEDILTRAITLEPKNLSDESKGEHMVWDVLRAFSQNGRPTVWAFNAIMKHCVDVKDTTSFERTKELMRDAKIQANTSTINIYLAHCIMSSCSIQPVLDQARNQGILLNRTTLMLKVEAYLSKQCISEAASVLDEFTQRNLLLEKDDEIFHLLMKACREKGNDSTSVATVIQAAQRNKFDVDWNAVEMQIDKFKLS